MRTQDVPFSKLHAGVVVRDRIWNGKSIGTIVRRKGTDIFVAWHNSFVEDQLNADDVKIVPDAPSQLQAWRGSVGVVAPGAPYTVIPEDRR